MNSQSLTYLSRRRVTRAFKVKVRTLGNMKIFMCNNVGSPSPVKFSSPSSRLFYDAEDKGGPGRSVTGLGLG